jgi:hypothetical protein
MQKILISLLLKQKSFPPRFASKRKLLNRSEAKNLKQKKAKKSEKIDFNFALLRFASKRY